MKSLKKQLKSKRMFVTCAATPCNLIPALEQRRRPYAPDSTRTDR
jgi:hypothetical protein